MKLPIILLLPTKFLKLENRFDKYEKSFLNTVERGHCLPACWEEIWKINRALKDW